MSRLLISLAALACLGLAGCGKSEEDIDPAPIAQLQGPWQMINRSATCESNYTVFSPIGIFRLYDGGARKKYVSIKKFTLEAGKVTLLTTGIGREPDDELSLVLSLVENRIRLLDIRSDKAASFKEPPKELEAAEQTYMKALFRISEQRFAMDKCVGA